jgi:hypothetical protein
MKYRTHSSLFVLLASAAVAASSLTALTITGCASGSTNSSNSTSALATGGAKNVYVIQQPAPGVSILQFSATSNGPVSPISVLTMPADLILYTVAVDNQGQIYAAGVHYPNQQQEGEILIYAAGASGAATPIRTISGGFAGSGSFLVPVEIAVDATSNLYVGSTGGIIAVFPPTANGMATPSRLIEGPLTSLSPYPGVFAVDKTGTIFIGGQATIVVFAPTANGNVAPSSELVVPGPANQTGLMSMTIDAAGDIYALSTLSGSTVETISEFAPMASGAATPIKTITTTISMGSIRVDAAGNLYYSTGVLSPGVGALPPAASGNAVPVMQITSPSWTSSYGHFALN